MSGIQVTTSPVEEPLAMQEVKDYLRVEDGVDERIIRPFIIAARTMAEEHTGRTLMPTTYTLFVDGYDELADPLWEGTRTGAFLNYYKNFIDLPKAPVQSVTSVSTFDDADVETSFASSRYYVDSVREPARIVLRQGETFPTAMRVANAIKIVYVAGYSNAFTVPEPIRMGMLQHIAFLYEHRGDMYETSGGLPKLIKHLYAPFVIHRGMGSSALQGIG
jgi:hypothetical protein